MITQKELEKFGAETDQDFLCGLAGTGLLYSRLMGEDDKKELFHFKRVCKGSIERSDYLKSFVDKLERAWK